MNLTTRSAFLVALIASVGAGATLFADEAAVKDATAKHDFSDGDRQKMIKGKALYGSHCLHCHGINMVTPGNAAFDLRQFPHDDKARFVNSVSKGKNNRMPAWGDLLKPEEIDQIWSYVVTGGKG
jgi:mono/diheme cytochrome c family protein